MRKTTKLKKMLEEKNGLVMPGAHDCISAKLIERAGFKALQVSGFGLAASCLGKPDVGLLTMTEMVNFTRNIANAVSIPVMGDGDTGFGNAINVLRTVQEFEQAGCAGINLEDQVFPKRCGHMEGKQLISKEEMVKKIQAGCDSRKDPDFVINARTDAIAVAGIEEAIERGKAYADAGADLIFIEAPQTKEEIRRVVEEIDAPISINLFDAVKGGKTPLMTLKELRNLGVARISIPTGPAFASVKGIESYLEVIKKEIAPGRYDLVCTFDHFKELVGLPGIKELEKKYLPKEVFEVKYKQTKSI
jgi:methylisocitrate lyase